MEGGRRSGAGSRLGSSGAALFALFAKGASLVAPFGPFKWIQISIRANWSIIDDFMYREYGIQGRWPSPDPLGPGAFNLANAQSLNRYAYVLNNPESLVDPLGLKSVYDRRTSVRYVKLL